MVKGFEHGFDSAILSALHLTSTVDKNFIGKDEPLSTDDGLENAWGWTSAWYAYCHTGRVEIGTGLLFLRIGVSLKLISTQGILSMSNLTGNNGPQNGMFRNAVTEINIEASRKGIWNGPMRVAQCSMKSRM